MPTFQSLSDNIRDDMVVVFLNPHPVVGGLKISDEFKHSVLGICVGWVAS